MDNFSFEIKEKSYYDFLCGRVKVLETYLLDTDTLIALKNKDFQSFVSVLQGYPYKKYISKIDFPEVREAIFKRREEEFEEFSKFGLEPFINVFLRSANYFLLVKKAYLGYKVSDDFKEFLLKGVGSYPKHFYECFSDLKKNKYPSYLIPIVIDSYYLSFLMDYAKLTKSAFIEEYYQSFTEAILIQILMRSYNFLNVGFLKEDEFLKIVEFLNQKFQNISILKGIDSVSSFTRMINTQKYFYREKSLSENWEVLTQEILKSILLKGKYFNEGIEPIFVYLLKLNAETSVLQKLAYALYYGLETSDISELELVYE